MAAFRQSTSFALRNIARQRARAVLTLCAISLGVASLVLSGGFVADTLDQLREATIHSQLGHLQIFRAGRSASTRRQVDQFLMEDSATVTNALHDLPHVVATARRLSFSGVIGNGRSQLPILGEGLEPRAETALGTALTVLEGRQLNDKDQFSAVLGEGLARAMKFKVGDRVDVVVSTPEGATNALEFQVVGVSRSLSKDFDARSVRIPLGAAQELIGTAAVSAVVVLLDDTEQTEPALSEIQRKLPPTFEVRTWSELATFYKSTEALYRRQFGFLQAIILVMVLLSVANTVNMMLHERTAEFGIMRALGRNGSDVLRLILLENLVLGVVGAGLGVALGTLLALVISAVGIPMSPPPNSESGFTAGVRVVPWVLVAAFACGVAATVCAALLPARHLARMPLVDALRRGV